MTHEELLTMAVDSLRKSQRGFERLGDKVSPEVRRLKVDEMLKRTICDAVVIKFEADDERGRIEVVMDSNTGAIIERKFIPPKNK